MVDTNSLKQNNQNVFNKIETQEIERGRLQDIIFLNKCKANAKLQEWRNIVLYLWIFLVVVLLCTNPFLGQTVSNCVTKCSKVVPVGCHISVFNLSEMQMPVEAFLHASDIFHQRNFT